jgi:hypothetical protein
MPNFLKPDKPDLQQRGHCQCCGRLQATDSLTMSLHGYTRKDGWFQGVCNGNRHQPIELHRAVADATVVQVRKECEELARAAEDMEAGKTDPEFIRGNKPFASLIEPHKQWERTHLATQIRHRHNEGIAFAKYLEDTANIWHGRPLTIVKKPPPTEPIMPGEIRLARNGNPLTCARVERGRVYFTSGSARSWLGTRSWRSLRKG